MRRLLVVITAGALLLAACASADGTNEEALPLNDSSSQTGTESQDSDEPIPTEPNDGIGDGATGEGLPVISPDLSKEIDLALADLADHLGDDRLIEIAAAHEVTWANGALGCPQPDMGYTEALVDGYRIELADGTYRFIYHGAAGSDPFLCVEGQEGSPDLVAVQDTPLVVEPQTPKDETEPTEQLGGKGGQPDE